MKITEHLNTKHKSYTIYDNYRSNANFIDGFKPSARKIFSVIDSFKSLTKIDIIATSTSLKTHYKHGSVNLEGVAGGLGQVFTGTNLFSMFKTKGFFGNRVSPQPGASRYISAMKNPKIDLLYRTEDFNILEINIDEGNKIEPKFYVPIIPAILLSSQSGIGNGYSQTIYSRNIYDLIKYIREWNTKDTCTTELLPYFEGFKGEISKTENNNQYNISGLLKIINTTCIEITELPINTSVDKYIKILEQLEDDKVIKSFKDKCHKNEINFEIKCPRELTKESEEKLYKIFKLKSTITETLTCIGERNQIVVFDSIYDIIEAYCHVRVDYYTKRKAFIIKEMEQDLLILNNKVNFISAVNTGFIELANKRKSEIEFKLYDSYYDKVDNSYDYLLGMKIYSLTIEKLEELEAKRLELIQKIEDYKKKEEKEIWLDELDELEKSLPKRPKKAPIKINTPKERIKKEVPKVQQPKEETKLVNPYKKMNELMDLF